MKTIEAAAADCVVDGIRGGLQFEAAMQRALEIFPTCDHDVLVAALLDDDTRAAVVPRAILMEQVRKVWDEMRLDVHGSFTVADAPVRQTLDFTNPESPDERRRVCVAFAMLHHWRADADLLSADGEAAQAEEQLRLLKVALKRAGGNYDARVIDVIDNPPAAA